MNTMGCNEFLNQLDVWMEGETHPDARAHMRSCPGCRAVVEDLNSISQVATTLAAEEANAPPERVWIALRSQLEREGLIHEPRAAMGPGAFSRLAGWLEDFSAGVPRPALAGAYLAVLIAVGFGLCRPIESHTNAENWALSMQSSTTPLNAELNNAEISAVSMAASSKSLIAASLHRNLDIVDNYISLCEKSVREDPENEVARDYLYEAYQQKADLLAQMSDRGVDGR
jgi:hypothetical protein